MNEYIKVIEQIAAKCTESQSDGYSQIMRICDAMREQQESCLGYISKVKMFKVGDLVYVSNSDTEYEKKYGERTHKSFFGTVTDVTEYTDEICVEVKFPATPNGCAMEWSYNANELSLAKEIKDMTIEELSNKFNLQIFAEYL